jgi:arylsulfatase A-like enzyme
MAKPLVDDAIDQDPHLPPRASVLLYPAALPLSRQTLTYVAGIIRRHRAQIGSPWRKLNPSGQALLVLAYLRTG